ncbi:MAG: leucine-rich repeat domain-containing protein [Lachnospiraceae bacterium]|nr:leucine-rich repeat domain-containing protein [Lachnospiraceae bacterium]
MNREEREYRLMELVGEIDEKYLEEAEYTREERERLAARRGATAVQATTEQEDDPAPLPVEAANVGPEGEILAIRANDVGKTASFTRITVGIILAAAAVLLFVFLWKPDRGHDVVSTTESSEQSTKPDEETTEETTQTSTEPTAEPIAIDAVHFPDDKFLGMVSEKFDKNEDGQLDEAEILKVTEIFVMDGDIGSLQGIEYFPDLQSLSCTNNPLKTLDLSHNPKLKIVYCGGAQLTELDVSANPDLQSLDCSGNYLEKLDVSKNPKLEMLLCYSNLLTELDVSRNSKLTFLHCYQNRLTSLNVAENLHLKNLDCHMNNLKTLIAPSTYESGYVLDEGVVVIKGPAPIDGWSAFKS